MKESKHESLSYPEKSKMNKIKKEFVSELWFKSTEISSDSEK